jgi:hypothetical protein
MIVTLHDFVGSVVTIQDGLVPEDMTVGGALFHLGTRVQLVNPCGIHILKKEASCGPYSSSHWMQPDLTGSCIVVS